MRMSHVQLGRRGFYYRPKEIPAAVPTLLYVRQHGVRSTEKKMSPNPNK